MKRFMKCFAFFCVMMLVPNMVDAASSNSPISWGFKRGANEQQAEADPTHVQILEKYGGFYKGSPDKKILYLTFDNGYENGYTGKILDVLKREKVHAIFFVTGHYLESASDLVKRMVKEGHIVGNHSWYHPDLTTNSDADIRKELNSVRDRTRELTGQKEMKYLRPPRGIFSERTLKVAKDEGYTHVMWSLAYVDWNVNQQRGAEYAYNSIMRQVHPGAVILLHTVSKDNADVLEKVIHDLKKRGYQFKSLDDFQKEK